MSVIMYLQALDGNLGFSADAIKGVIVPREYKWTVDTFSCPNYFHSYPQVSCL